MHARHRQRERERVGVDRYDVGDLDRPLRRQRRPVEMRVEERRGRACRSGAGSAASTCCATSARRPPSAGRIRPAARCADRRDRRRTRSRAAACPACVAAVDRRCARGMPTACASSSALALAARQRQRRARIGHRMQVEQVVGAIVERPQLARARELARCRAAVEHLGGPQAVEVLVDAARRERIAGVEASGTPRRWRRPASACRAPAGSRSRSSQSSAIAPHTSLPCVSAWTVTLRAGAVAAKRQT